MASSRLVTSCWKVPLLMASCSSRLSASESQIIWIEIVISTTFFSILVSHDVAIVNPDCVLTLTPHLADVQDVSNDAVGDFGRRLVPSDLQGVGGQGIGCEALGGSRQIFRMGHSQPGAGLIGAGAVFCDALVNGLIL